MKSDMVKDNYETAKKIFKYTVLKAMYGVTC